MAKLAALVSKRGASWVPVRLEVLVRVGSKSREQRIDAAACHFV